MVFGRGSLGLLSGENEAVKDPAISIKRNP